MNNEEILQEEVNTEAAVTEEIVAEEEREVLRNENGEELIELETFTVEMPSGSSEWTVVDEFEFEDRLFLICCEVIGDKISSDGMYIFEDITEGDEFKVKNLETAEEYERVAEAYCNLEE